MPDYNYGMKFWKIGGTLQGRRTSMTIEEVSEHYNMPMEVLKMYERWNLCGEVKKVIQAWKYDDTDLERLGLIMSLHNLGFSNEEIEKYMCFELKGDETKRERVELIKKKRTELLDGIHENENRVRELDFMKYELEKEKVII